jgi:hypothetical protein
VAISGESPFFVGHEQLKCAGSSHCPAMIAMCYDGDSAPGRGSVLLRSLPLRPLRDRCGPGCSRVETIDECLARLLRRPWAISVDLHFLEPGAYLAIGITLQLLGGHVAEATKFFEKPIRRGVRNRCPNEI